jgi:murein DD-endopeptidase MepM/ murein hydrolase activator NlpD
MKKIINIILSICLLIALSIPTTKAEAKTLSDIRTELNKLITERNETENKKKLTNSQINNTKSNISTTMNQIDQAGQNIKKAEQEIIELNYKIIQKDKETKELLNFLQVSEGDSEYLEYAFGAQDFTDFIYRMAVVEQLSDYNDKLLKEMNAMIVQNENKKKELKQQQIYLADKKQTLSEQLNSLGKELSKLSEVTLDINAEIKATSDLIKFYEGLGCKNDQDVNTCAKVPADSKFYRPLTNGRVTSEFGYRIHPVSKTYKFHNGIDLGGNSEGTNVYPAAAGRIAATIYYQSCGGNTIFVHHLVGGKYYTTGYTHLLSIKVKVGDIVSKDTVIGTVGGGTATKSYDKCSTGPHLHFAVASGLYLGSPPYGYNGWSTYLAHNENPRNRLSFPGYYISWSGR